MEGSASSSSRGRALPTPLQSDGDKGGPGQRFGTGSPTLGAVAPTLLPTPEAKTGSSGPDYARAGRAGSGGDDLVTRVAKILPTPVTTDANGSARHTTTTGVAHAGTSLTDAIRTLPDVEVGPLLPTPNPFHAGNDEEVEEWRARRADVFERTGTRHGPALSVVAKSVVEGDPLTPDRYMPDGYGVGVDDDEELVLDLLGTPAARDWKGSGAHGSERQVESARRGQVEAQVVLGWGDYGPAIRRWERVLGREAPPPTEPNRNGDPRLSPAFVEWMMGLDAGHVTDAPISRAHQLKALGNGVVPQQAAEAYRRILGRNPEVVAALLEG